MVWARVAAVCLILALAAACVEFLGWANGSWLTRLCFLIFLVAFVVSAAASAFRARPLD